MHRMAGGAVDLGMARGFQQRMGVDRDVVAVDEGAAADRPGGQGGGVVAACAGLFPDLWARRLGGLQALRMSSWAAANAWQASWQPKHRDGALEKPVQAEAAAVCASREWQGAHSCSGSQTHSSCKDTCSASAIPGISVGAAGGDWQLARPAAKHRQRSAQVAPASARGLCFPLRRIGHACFLKRSCTSFMVPALKPSLKELGTTMRLLPPPSFTLSFTMLAMRIWSAISSWRYSSAAPT